jgi:hypothetical protein
MKVALIAVGSAVALLCAGCSKIEMARVAEQKERDEAMIVQRYKQASLPEVEAVLNDYLAIADTYERRGWAKYGPPGWIEYLRALCEGRLAVFFKASGKQDLYRLHMERAVAHLKKRSPGVVVADEQAATKETAARLEELVNGLDIKNIDPNWRKQLGQPNGGANRSQPIRSDTSRTLVPASSGH